MGLDVVAVPAHATNGIANTGRLIDPLGYWNAMGLIGIIGLLIALGLLSRSANHRSPLVSPRRPSRC